MKKLVNAPLSNKIYWATVNEKTHTMNTSSRIDVTDNAVDAVFEHITHMEGFAEKGWAGYEYPERNSANVATLCVIKSDKVVCISKEDYNKFLEYKTMYENLCK
jgi:hypothetical protein